MNIFGKPSRSRERAVRGKDFPDRPRNSENQMPTGAGPPTPLLGLGKGADIWNSTLALGTAPLMLF